MNARHPHSLKISPVDVILIEDEPSTQDHLIQVIESSPCLRLQGLANTVRDAYSLLLASDPQVVLIDLGLPDSSGIEIIHWLSNNRPQTECLVLTTFGDEHHVVKSLEAGANGYLLKDCPKEELIEHILAITNGGSPISPLIARQLLNKIQHRNAPPINKRVRVNPIKLNKVCSVTGRELSVIQQVARGFNPQEIALQMGISTHSVATHVKKIYKKLHVHHRLESVCKTSKFGLLDL